MQGVWSSEVCSTEPFPFPVGLSPRGIASAALATEGWHWLTAPRRAPFACTVKVRYRQTDQEAVLEPRADGTARIRFVQPQRAVTPGQYAVAYEGERCLGGGVIASVAPPVRESAAA